MFNEKITREDHQRHFIPGNLRRYRSDGSGLLRQLFALVRTRPIGVPAPDGLPYTAIEQAGFHFPVMDVNCHYNQSAHFDEVVQIESELAEMGRVSLSFSYRISRETDTCLLATGSTKHACIDHAGHVTRIPKILEDA